VFFMHSASAVDIYRAQRKHINYSIWPMRISRHDLRRRYSNLLVIDAGSQFSLRACSQATGGLVSYLTMWLLTFQLFKNIIDTQEKIRLNLHSLSVSELLEYGCKCITICKRILQTQIIIYAISNNALSHLHHQWSKRNEFKGNF
jgi:hypothetical protein